MSDDYIEPPAGDPSLLARLTGYSWDEIDSFINGRSQEALAAGYSPEEIAAYLGRGNPDNIQNRVAQDLQYRVSADPQFASGLQRPDERIPLTPLDELPSTRISSYGKQDTPPQVDPFGTIEPPSAPGADDEHARQSYANALLRGEAQSPRDFAERYAGALWQAVPDADPGALARTADNLVLTLPSDQDFTDAAIAIARSQGVAVGLGAPPTEGRLSAGNINLYDRPQVFNPETGGTSSTWAMSFGTDQGEVLVPRISDDGRILSEQEAIEQYDRTGRNFGVFDTPDNATAYAHWLHDEQASLTGLDDLKFVKNAVVNEWSSTGDDLMDIYRKAQTDPTFADSLTVPPREESPWYAPFVNDDPEGAVALSETMWPLIQEGVSAWWTWRVEQSEEEQKNQLSWDQLKKGVTPEQLMADPAFNMALGLISPLQSVGLPMSALAKVAPTLHPADAGQLLDRVAGIMRDMPEPKVHVIDPAVVGPNAEVSASEAFRPVAPARAEVSLGKAEQRTTVDGTYDRYPIMSGEREIGRASVTVMEDGKLALLDDISVNTAEESWLTGTNTLGPKEVRQLARQFFLDNPEVERIAGMRVTGARSATENMNEVVEITRAQALRGLPEFAETATPAAKMQAIGREWLENRAGVLEDLRLRNEGITPDEFGPTFFRQLAAKQDPATVALAEGMDTAHGVLRYLTDLGGRLLRDESGALNILKTPAQRTVREGFIENRDYVQPLLIRGMGVVGRQMAEYASMFDRYPTGSTNWYGGQKFQNLYKLLTPHMPEWEAEIAKGPMGNAMGTKVGDMVRYIEGRSSGYRMQPDNPLAPLADTIRAVNKSTRQLMEDAQARGLHNLQSYYEDYFRHIWADPTKADQTFGVGIRGSGRSFQMRSIPTIEDGLNAGLVPKYANPIDLTLADAAEKIRYLQTLDMVDAATKSHTITGNPFVYFAGKAKDNDIPLLGVGTSRDIATPPTVARQKAVVDARAARDAIRAQIRATGAPATPQMATRLGQARAAVTAAEKAAAPEIVKRQAYANPGFANNWNDMLSKGFFSRDFSGKVFENLNYIKNVATQYQLMFPAFHAQTMAIETLAGGFGNAFTEAGSAVRLALQGQGGRAAAEAGYGVLDFAKSASGYKFGEMLYRGHQGINAYRNMAQNEVIQLLTESNARFGDRVALYRFGSAPSLWESYQRGQVGQELKASFRYLIGDKTEPIEYRLAQIPLRRLWGFAAHETARLLNTATAPLFDFVIPRLKIGANMEAMQTFLRENPTASYEAKLARARQIVNNTDDRMGEMQMDNIFWPKTIKQTAQLAMISPGWVYGSIRFFTSAAGLNLERRAFEWNPVATSKFMGLVTAYALQNSITQYFMTGKLPWTSDTPFQDMFIGGTTGAIVQGARERMLQPGQQKELFDYGKILAHAFHDPMTIGSSLADFALGKMPGIWQAVRGLVTGKDAIGHDIAQMPGGWAGFFAKTITTPIFTGAFAQRKQGTGIAEWQTLIGWKEVPTYAQNPERFYHGLEVAEAIHAREERNRVIAENRIYEQQKEVPDAVAQPGSGYRSIRRSGADRGYTGTLDANGLPLPAGGRAADPAFGYRSIRGPGGGRVGSWGSPPPSAARSRATTNTRTINRVEAGRAAPARRRRR